MSFRNLCNLNTSPVFHPLKPMFRTITIHKVRLIKFHDKISCFVDFEFRAFQIEIFNSTSLWTLGESLAVIGFSNSCSHLIGCHPVDEMNSIKNVKNPFYTPLGSNKIHSTTRINDRLSFLKWQFSSDLCQKFSTIFISNLTRGFDSFRVVRIDTV